MLPDCFRMVSPWLVVASVAVVSGCGGDDTSGPPPTPTSTGVDGQPASPTAAVRFKGNQVLANDLARGLSLEHEAVCNELGTFSCTDEVHKVTLGGVDAYERQIYEPTRRTTATTPLAAERVVMSACLERARRDFTAPGSATIFTGLLLDGAKISNPTGDEIAATIDTLYVQLLSRHATSGEVHALEAYYADVEASGDAAPAKTWAGLSCFAVGSSAEFLFY